MNKAWITAFNHGPEDLPEILEGAADALIATGVIKDNKELKYEISILEFYVLFWIGERPSEDEIKELILKTFGE